MSAPVFTLPPYRVEQVFTTFAETVDWGLKLLNVPGLWRLTRGAGVKVAVLDTGCALQHPDLRDAVVKAKDFTRSRSGPADTHGHGTHCAGVIAARENSSGVVGVAPEAGLLIGKVLGDGGSGSLKAVVAGIDWAVAQGAAVISMSLGASDGSPELAAAVDRAEAAGVFLICAAGNEGPGPDTVGYPAMYSNTVAVAAIDRLRRVAKFSSRGNRVDIAAPGVDILSCYPPRGLAKLSGTSMAAPFVAGVVALMVAKHRAYGTDTDLKTHADLIRHLKETAADLGPAGHDTASGWGLVDPAALLAEADGGLALAAEDFSAAGKAKLKAHFGAVPGRALVQVV